MPKDLRQQGGVIPILILLAAIGILGFLFITNSFDFKDRFFSRLFPKPPSFAKQEPKSVPGEIIVKYKDSVAESGKVKIRQVNGLNKKDEIKELKVERVKVEEKNKKSTIEELKKDPNVEYALPNYIAEELFTPVDPIYTSGLQWNPKPIGAPAAWDLSKGETATGSAIVVAVIDSGVNSSHSDLLNQILPGFNFVDNNTDIRDVTGHGTLVMGVIAAIHNTIGVAGLSPASKILPLAVVNSSGGAGLWQIAQAITYAANNGAKVINISLGAPLSVEDAPYLQTAINAAWNQKGIVIVGAAGNSGTSPIVFPASANNVIAVGGTRSDDTRAAFSSTGAGLDLVAPGEGIYTPEMGGSYTAASGTSFSSPHAAALAALLFSANPSMTNQQVVDIINKTADKVGDMVYDDFLTNGCNGWNEYFGCGRINACKALKSATGSTITCLSQTQTPTPTSTPTPTVTPTSTPTTNSVVISSISSTTTGTSATIKWTTNIPSTSRVGYGLTQSLGSLTTEDTNLTTNHSTLLTGLTKATFYYYKIYSKNSAGLETASSINQFKTKK